MTEVGAVASPWLIVWRCGCSDAQFAKADLPVVCPHHPEALVLDGCPTLIFPTSADDKSLMMVGHDCDPPYDDLCIGVTRDVLIGGEWVAEQLTPDGWVTA